MTDSDSLEAQVRELNALFTVDPGAALSQLRELVTNPANLQSDFVVRFAGEIFAKLLWAGLIQDDVIQELPGPCFEIFQQCNSLSEEVKIGTKEWSKAAVGDLVPRTRTLPSGRSTAEAPPGLHRVAEILKREPTSGIAALKSICEDPEGLPTEVVWAANKLSELLWVGFSFEFHGAEMTEEAFTIWYDWPC